MMTTACTNTDPGQVRVMPQRQKATITVIAAEYDVGYDPIFISSISRSKYCVAYDANDGMME